MSAPTMISAAQLWVRGPVAVRARPDKILPQVSGAPGRPSRAKRPADQGISWVSAHGGAGTTTLAKALGGRDMGTRWPDTVRGHPARILLVARTHAAGLQAASRALDALRTGRLPAENTVLALVLVADAPGRLPARLARRVRVLRSAVDTIRVPWVQAWRLGESTENTPKELVKIAALIKP
jgi:hypothetical protein